jgi:hypothetical protein
MNINYLAECEKNRIVFKENCLQFDKKIVKVKLKAWSWANGQDSPEGLEVIIEIDGIHEDQINGFLLASDSLPVLDGNYKNAGAAVIKYPIIHSIELINESDLALFVGYPNTYERLEKKLKES